MPDMMAIVSKAIFEKAAGKSPKVGTKLAMDRYVSTNKNLEPLAQGGTLYLVTVRPPDEALWLVAVLDKPRFDGKQWISAACDTAITDISALRTQIKFESGKGMSTAPGALGMSLQTPRALTSGDVALLAAALGTKRGEIVVPPASNEVATGNADRLAQLLAAVIADPENDLPRQVYADELVTRNDPRGEFIQIDLALAGPLSIRKRDVLGQRREELAKQHKATWWPYRVQYRTSRGFIEAVSGKLAELASAPELFAKEPVVEVTISGERGKGGAKKIADSVWLARARRLVVRGALGDDGFATLVASERAQTLRSLNVSVNELSAEGLESLGDNLPACTTLVLTANEIGDEGIAALRTWSHLANVETLYLSDCQLSSDAVEELLAAPLPKLVKLSLSNNELNDGIADTFAEHAANVPALRYLELKNAGISRDAIETFKRLSLSRLDLRRNDIHSREVVDFPFVRAGHN